MHRTISTQLEVHKVDWECMLYGQYFASPQLCIQPASRSYLYRAARFLQNAKIDLRGRGCLEWDSMTLHLHCPNKKLENSTFKPICSCILCKSYLLFELEK